MNTATTPTAVLVHGAFADASGFAGIVRELTTEGYRVIAPANPLRGIENDAATVRAAAAAVTTARSCWSVTPTAAP